MPISPKPNEFPSHAERHRIAELAAENARLREGIQAFLDGNYPHPRSHRPNPCPHGIEYWNDCGQCNDEHFERLLR